MSPPPAASGGPRAGLWSRIDLALARLRLHRLPLVLLADGLVVCAAWNLAYFVRLGFERQWNERPGYDGWLMLGVAAAYLGVFALRGVPKAMWRFSGFGELKRLTSSCAIAGAAAAGTVLALQLVRVPRTVLVLHPLITLIGLCGARLAYRMLYEHVRGQITGGDAEVRRAVVLGAGQAARMVMAGLHRDGWVVLGLFDDHPAKRGARIGDAAVLGPLDAVASRDGVMREATHVIVAMPGATAAARRRAIDLAAGTTLPVMTVPSVSELRDGTVRRERVRAIEPEDLLGRDPVVLDEAGIGQLIAGQVVLVTGAGGSIGSELCRQIARYRPAAIVLYELSEYALYRIEQELGESFPDLPLVRLIGDVKDLAHLRRVFGQHRPALVFHAAAFKHVPLMEDENAWAALQNNTVGTWNAATAAAEAGVARFVLISTDKAVNPTSVMGATKRAAEMVVSHLAAQGHATVFSAVRFGNVLGSSGSVIPKFKEQIAKGGPVTVTHPEMTRYFMTIPEAARLVLQAAALARSGQVCILDMGEPVRIVDLARTMIRMSGHREEEIGIVFSGVREGEKLVEELLSQTDRTRPSSHPSLRVADLRVGAAISRALLEWLQVDRAAGRPAAAVKAGLRQLIPEFAPPDDRLVSDGAARAGRSSTTSAS